MFKNGIASVSVNSQQANIAETFSPVWAFKKSYRAKRQGKVILAGQFYATVCQARLSEK